MREILFILLAALIAFGGAAWAPFHLDDFALRADPAITAPDGWIACLAPLQTRPLTWLSFWLNYRIGGENPFGYHVANLALHLVNVSLVFVVLRRLVPSHAALFAAGLFAVHPIQTEAVVYVFDRATLLMASFCLLSMKEWVSGRHWRAVIWFIPALLAKEECVSLPVFYLLLHFSMSRNRKEWAPIGVMIMLSVAAGARVLIATSHIAGSGAGLQAGVTPFDYLCTQGVVLWRYLRLVVLPAGFSIEAPMGVTTDFASLAGWIGIAAILVVSLRRFADAREGFWAWACFILIAPSSTFLPANDLSADRRMYLPMIAIGVMIGMLPFARRHWVLAGLMVVMTALSFQQTSVWQSGEKLWRQALQAAPGKIRPRIQLARHVAPAEAIDLLNQAQGLAPRDPSVASEKGRVYLESGNASAALGEFGRALALDPGNAHAVNNRGVALLRLGQRETAIAEFKRALEMDACLEDARYNLRSTGVVVERPVSCSGR